MSGGPDPLHDLELLLRSRYGLVVIETTEGERVDSLLRHLADRLSLPLFTWTRTKGLRRAGHDGAVYGTANPGGALEHIESAGFEAVYHLRDVGPDLEDPVVAGRLGDAARPFEERPGALVLTGPEVPLPESLRPLAARLELPPPDVEEFRSLLRHLLRDLRARGRVEVDLTPTEEDRLLRNLRGLTLMEAEKALTRAIVEDGKLSPEDLRNVVRAKKELIEREGLLEYYPVEESLAEVADLDALKAWLRKRRAIIDQPRRAQAAGLPFPRGLLLLGVPGCGKSLCARAVAREWEIPLLRLDPSSLYNKYVGESERNFRRAIAAAERTAPVVLWIDEIEKALATAGDADGGLSLRILGTFLTWLQERRGDVFVVATANDVTRLPPELLRKGRFDEVFFVDLPDQPTREAILAIHLRKRGHDPDAFDLRSLAEAMAGFSGSEIEGVVVAGLYTAFSAGEPLDGDTLRREVEATRPLSRTMAERIEALREWAGGRTVPAH